MVIQGDSDLPMEVPFVTETQIEVNPYVVVKNHMREVRGNVITENKCSDTSEPSKQNEEEYKSSKKRKRKHDKSFDLKTKAATEYNETSNTHVPTTISESDLEELKSVYKKCKAIVKKIETKYGHLLNISEPGPSQSSSCSSEEEKCTCSIKKKIIYDDNGLQITKELDLNNHICPKKLKSSLRKNTKRNIQIEYEGTETTLPDDLQTLSNMLHDPTLEITYRNKVINKIKLIKQEYMNDLKFNKHLLVENIKSDPYKVLDFKGTNLDELKGY
ncbi:uncharacterized protein ACR2FA_003823 [Aphomia sociella]